MRDFVCIEKNSYTSIMKRSTRFLLLVTLLLFDTGLYSTPPEIQNIQGFLASVAPGGGEAAAILFSGPDDREGSGGNTEAIRTAVGDLGGTWYRADYVFRQQPITVLLRNRALQSNELPPWRSSDGLCPGRRVYSTSAGRNLYSLTATRDITVLLVNRDEKGLLCEFLDVFFPLAEYFYRELGPGRQQFPAVLGALPP